METAAAPIPASLGGRRLADSAPHTALFSKLTELKTLSGHGPQDLGVDFATLRREYPYSRFTIDALEKFVADRERHIDAYPVGFPTKVYDAIQEKLGALEADSHAAQTTLNKLVETLQSKKEDFQEKSKFLHEIHVNDILAEHPQWMDQIIQEVENLQFRHPTDDTPFQQE